jgi:hypothetical protein
MYNSGEEVFLNPLVCAMIPYSYFGWWVNKDVLQDVRKAGRREHLSVRPAFPKLWSAVVRQVVCRRFRKKSNTKIVSDTERMKNTPIRVCAKTTFVGWPSTEIRRISSFHNFLSFSHYFRKYFNLVNRIHLIMVTLTTGAVFFPFTCVHLWVWGILRRWSAYAPTAFEMVHDCRKFEKVLGDSPR